MQPMKHLYKIRFILLFVIAAVIVSCSEWNRDQRTTFTMNTSWGFFLGDTPDGSAINVDDAKWQAIALPHIMRLEPKHCGGNIIYQGVGWYRRYFRLDPDRQGEKVYIDFEGVMTNCEVYVNGNKVTEHHGGYLGFEVDASPFVNWTEDNVLAVRVSAQHDPLTPPAKPQEGMDFNYFSGIYRDVRLTYKDPLHITNPLSAQTEAGGGIFVTYPLVSKEKAVVDVKTQIVNENTVSVNAKLSQTLIDKNGNVVAEDMQDIGLYPSETKTIEQKIDVLSPDLWHPLNPSLYTLRTEVLKEGQKVDCQTTNIGIHTIAHKKDGFYINGEKIYLRGTNRHQCFPNVGDAVSNSMHERDVIQIKQGGYHAVRAAHYPHDPAFLDACDKYGLLVIECIPGWQYWNNDPVFAQRLYQACREMIRRDRNHPSIFLWETMLNETRYPKAVADSIYKIAHSEMPGDQMYTVGDYWGHKEVSDCFDVYYKQVDRFPPDGDVMTNIPDDMISIAAQYSREWGDGAGEKPRASIAEDEFEQMRQCRSRLEALDGRGYFDWCMLDANPNMGGHFSWCFMDITRGLSRTTEYCGAVDLNRYPKFSYYMHQSMRDARISQTGLFEGPMVHIASYNAGKSLASSSEEIWVFSNCDSVKLYRNSALIGSITRKEAAIRYQNIVNKGGSPAFRFKVDGYEAGTLRAEAYLDGAVAARHEVTTAGKPHHINIKIHNAGIQPLADGSDMIPVWFEVADADGNRVSDSEALIHVEVEGEGMLIGKDNDYAGIENQFAEGGVGFCFVRTTRKPGKVRIIASIEGLLTSDLTVTTYEPETREVEDGNHGAFVAKEVVPKKDSTFYLPLSQRYNPVKINSVYTSHRSKYPVENIIDGDDESWWVSSSSALPQSVAVEFKWSQHISAGRIKFQKDSSTYKYRVEITRDGSGWEELFVKESTGWDIKPFKIASEIKAMRITFLEVSEGNPGLAEVSLYE